MRVSADKRDRGHRFDLDLRRVRVSLDGRPFARAVTADEEEGLVVAYRHDSLGRRVVERGPDGAEGFALEVIRGKVRVEVLGDDGLSVREPKVLVERERDGGLQVLAYSRVRQGRIRRQRLPASLVSALSEEQLRQACGVAAGAGAEHCCEAYGDVFDPARAADAGMRACRDLMAREARLARH